MTMLISKYLLLFNNFFNNSLLKHYSIERIIQYSQKLYLKIVWSKYFCLWNQMHITFQDDTYKM